MAARVTVDVAPFYAQGGFGLKETTEIYYLPVVLGYQQDAAKLKLTIPYLAVRGPVTLISGDGGIVPGSALSAVGSRSGLGDIWLEGSYRFRGSGLLPDQVPYAKIKFGTASHDKGLGTGETDYELGVSYEWAAKNLFPFLTVGYRVVGEPADIVTRNIAVYDGGLTYRLTPQQYATAMFVGSQAVDPAFPRAADFVLAWDYSTTGNRYWQVFTDIGLSNGSPDFGLGVKFGVRY